MAGDRKAPGGIDWDAVEVGYDVPARPGMLEADIQTPALVIDLDAFERNVSKLKGHCDRLGVRLRVHGKMHKSADVARYQIAHGGAVGVCCQKVSEAEAFLRAGIGDVLISNEVRDPLKIDRLARLPRLGRVIVCVDDPANVAELSGAALEHGTTIEALVEIDCGQKRCGCPPGRPAAEIARAIADAPGLMFSGIQAYNGSMQHFRDYAERRATADGVIAAARVTVEAIAAEGLTCSIVGGAGTGTYALEGASGVYNELQCGSFAFMDADYGRIRDANGARWDESEFEHALFLLTSVMSHPTETRAVCDAGLKAQSVDSGLPVIFGRDDVTYVSCSDEHGVIDDPAGVLKVNEKLKLVPGHCDPTCNIHDWFVGVRSGQVEVVWPVTARGKAF